MFKLKSNLIPSGDQPQAIKKIVDSFLMGSKKQVLLGATGTGKTFTIANIINELFKKTNLKKSSVIYLVNNKNLVIQTFKEMQKFFPKDKVRCYISYFDYYRPEAYKPLSDTYLAKKVQINKEIIRMRLDAIYSLISNDNVIIVSSVACIYGCLKPEIYKEEIITIFLNQNIADLEDEEKIEDKFLRLGYHPLKSEEEKGLGFFYIDEKKIEFSLDWNDEYYFSLLIENGIIVNIWKVNFNSETKFDNLESVFVPPNRDYVRKKEKDLEIITKKIEAELNLVSNEFKNNNKLLERERINKRVKEDILKIKNTGTCNGIENYSRYFDNRKPKETPFTILDFFPNDFLTVIDESHISIPQIKGMHNTNYYRIKTLVENGFRLPSAFDNRPLNLEEFFEKINKVLYVSATPGDFELKEVNYNPVEQIIRPTGILDPIIKIKSAKNQILDIIELIKARRSLGERVLIYTLTIVMSEEISDYLRQLGFKVIYIHSKLDIAERHQIINNLRRGVYDVIVGINLLKEGIDLPEVSLVCILDADKAGFLRDYKSLIQIIGRASRNINGEVVLYSDNMTKDIIKAVKETERRRIIQKEDNLKKGIIPKNTTREIRDYSEAYDFANSFLKTIEDDNGNLDLKSAKLTIKKLTIEMKKFVKKFDFNNAAYIRNIIFDIKKKCDKK